MKKWLLNPFDFIAGLNSLLIGLLVIVLTSLVCWKGGLHLDGVLDMHSNDSPSSFTLNILEGKVDWLCMVLFLFIAGRIFSSSSIRLIDVAGTQAMARAPFLLSALISIVFPQQTMMSYFKWKFLHIGEAVEIGAGVIIPFVLLSIVMIAILIWTVVLMYRAYSVSCNVKESKGVLSFIGGLLLAEIASKIILHFIYNSNI